ncbi:hypothetical protein KAW08_02550 [bacterium]|nr:hypothetical protein [bacterium]
MEQYKLCEEDDKQRRQQDVEQKEKQIDISRESNKIAKLALIISIISFFISLLVALFKR